MKNIISLTALVVFLFAACLSAADPTPAPATRVAFTLPLSDGQTVQAVFLPGPDKTVLIVYWVQGKLITGTLAIDGEIKPPVPPEPPVPPPPIPPMPSPEKIYGVIVVHESGQDTPELGALINSKAIRGYCESKKWRFRPYDPNTVDENNKDIASLKTWSDKAKSLPYYFVVGKDGSTIQEGTLPSESNLLGILQKIGG